MRDVADSVTVVGEHYTLTIECSTEPVIQDESDLIGLRWRDRILYKAPEQSLWFSLNAGGGLEG